MKALAALAALLPVLFAAPARAATLDHVDNMRFGLTSFQDAQTAALFAGLNGVSAGFDFVLGRGFAVSVDTVNLYKDFGTASYFLSVNPVQLEYRFGIPLGDSVHLLPYGRVGAGASFMGLLGESDGFARAGVGYAGSAAVGLQINQALTMEIGYGGGRVGGITDYGLQLRMGTGFSELGELPFLPWKARAAEEGVSHVEAKPRDAR